MAINLTGNNLDHRSIISTLLSGKPSHSLSTVSAVNNISSSINPEKTSLTKYYITQGE